jgi:hypothetical protein
MVYKDAWHTFGKTQEAKILPFLREHFGREIKTQEDRFSKHDFYDDQFNYELKSRHVKSTTYRDTLIATNKIQGEKELILVFNFRDCLAYILYDKERFDGYTQQYINGDHKLHYMVPVEHLEIIKNWE